MASLPGALPQHSTGTSASYVSSLKLKKPGRIISVECNALRPIPVRLISVGKSKSPAVQSLARDYADKIRRYCPFEDVAVPSNPKNTRDVKVQTDSEAERVLKVLRKDDYVVLLDERGREVTSEQFAAVIEKCASEGHNALVLCVGGPYGHGEPLRGRANETVRLSKLVLNHDIALLVLLEQLYRAWTIIKGEKYHH